MYLCRINTTNIICICLNGTTFKKLFIKIQNIGYYSCNNKINHNI